MVTSNRNVNENSFSCFFFINTKSWLLKLIGGIKNYVLSWRTKMNFRNIPFNKTGLLASCFNLTILAFFSKGIMLCASQFLSAISGGTGWSCVSDLIFLRLEWWNNQGDLRVTLRYLGTFSAGEYLNRLWYPTGIYNRSHLHIYERFLSYRGHLVVMHLSDMRFSFHDEHTGLRTQTTLVASILLSHSNYKITGRTWLCMANT